MSRKCIFQLVLVFLALCFTTLVHAQPIHEDCSSSLPTNIVVGSRVKVAFITGTWLLEAHVDPQEQSEIDSVIGAGDRLVVEDGPVCANGVLWWKVSSYLNSVNGWVPEESSGTRFILRLTKDPQDLTATYDVFAPYGSGPWHIEAQTLIRLYGSADNSTVTGHIIPGFAYEVIGRNESGGMFQVMVNGSVGWVCGDNYFITFDQRPHQVPVTDGSTFNCTWQDHYFDSEEELNAVANATNAQYFKPGEYPKMQLFAETVAKVVGSSDVLMSKTSSILSLIVNTGFIAKSFVVGTASAGTPIEVACTLADLQNIGISIGDPVGELTPSQTLICIVMDTTTVASASVQWGSVYGATQLFLNSDSLNEFLEDRSLSSTICYFMVCYLAPGVQ